jgi:hypothetical protein
VTRHWDRRFEFGAEYQKAARGGGITDWGKHPSRISFFELAGLYDKRFITADRYSSGTAEWVLYGDRHFYTLSVISRPFYALPQELCLAFDCFTTTKTFGRGASTGPPFDEVAVEFAALLSVLAREALVPLGPRRIGDKPIRFESPYVPPQGGSSRAETGCCP